MTTKPIELLASYFTLAGDVYQMTYGNVVNTFAKTVYLMRREGTTNCLNAVTATKQP